MMNTTAIAAALTIAMQSAGAGAPVPEASRAHPEMWPAAHSPAAMTDARTEAFVRDLLARMTIEEKVGQTIQADIASIKPEDLLTYPLGSVLAGGTSGPGGDDRAPAQAWVDLAAAFRAAAAQRPGARVPLLFGVDAVHGHNNIFGATIFPHNIGLGAAHDPDLIRRIGAATAEEIAATGADWTFAPTLAVPRDDRWGRTLEGYAEIPDVQVDYAGAMVEGLQGVLSADRPIGPERVVSSAKHFLADGGTDGGHDQGDFKVTERELIDIHLGGYPDAINAGALTIMASFSSWNGVKHTGNPTILRDVLKGRLGFEGFVVGDWNAHGQLPGCTTVSCPEALEAGLDMYMAPDSWRGLYDNTLAQVRSGRIPMAVLDDAVTRILRVKVKAGVFEPSRYALAGELNRLGAPDHLALAREAVRKSLVLLKNEGSVLPIRPGARVLVAGDADDIGQASGGWTISWQGTGNSNVDFPNGQSIWAGLRDAVAATGGEATLSADGEFQDKPDVAVVVFGETPYAEGQGDVRHLDYRPEKPLEILKRLKAAGVPTVAVFLTGRPLWMNPEINASDAFVSAWLPGTQGQGVADVLVADRSGKVAHDFTGRLTFSWPRTAEGTPLNVGQPGYDPLFAYGYGLSYAKPGSVGTLPEVSGVDLPPVNLDRFFVTGRFQPPWTMSIRDAAGVTAVTSPRGASASVAWSPTDGAIQEDSLRLAFSGQALVGIGGDRIDLSERADRALTFRARVETPITGALWTGMGMTFVDLAPLTGPVGEWRAISIPLRCLAQSGVELRSVDQPFSLVSTAPLTVSLADIRLSDAPASPEVPCPKKTL
ncbi:beta-glucosidase [Brevundimonas nasdae]|nr:glycoside hydrolase family 3 N-terminal domain-containing protein [Brevundimonas nasdae]MBK6025825.1 glycoside hydrolase family 3 C-terminal domain-containing protein [Brevundimonas nasdae]MDQ0452322.1 beta-glucosidase [Brevundimonas nasdae]